MLATVLDYSVIEIIVVLLIAYIVGSIPFGLLIANLKKVNLRELGSGNIGATNVCRNIGWFYGIVTLILDSGKGYLITEIALYMFENPWLHVIIGLFAIIGHSLSFLAQFKGGKGVATALGVLMALSPDVCIGIFIIGALLIALTRYVSPVTILCSIIVPILLYLREYPIAYVVMHSIIALFIVIRHRNNIKRIFLGTENRI
tara:strand:+ start:241 stop:846 length:606 start_codon:yes stop_codon:yes gene_type:complete